jgi:ABC-type multidrug transport system fused ATPase/permease subunit
VALAILVIIVNIRLQNSRVGRAWQAIREDEVAAKACGINTRNIKLLAFAMGASFGGIAGGVFSAMQGFVSPESFSLMESITILAMVVLGGMGHIPGVILGAILLTALPEVLRYGIEPLQDALFGRMIIDPESLRMLIFGLSMVLVMRFRPAGLWPSPQRRRELAESTRLTMSEPQILLEAHEVAKHFGGVKALHDVSLTIRRGEIYGLIGPNGAGKTTFFNCLTGLYKNESGHFVFDGVKLAADAPHKAAEVGIARTFQNIRLFGNMSAIENVMVGRHLRTHAGVLGAIIRNRATMAEEAAITRRAEELLHYVGIHERAHDLCQAPFLRRPAPARDCPRPGHRTQAAGARRAGCGNERHRNRSLADPCRRHLPGWRDGLADRA